jgi:hypothetical protein
LKAHCKNAPPQRFLLGRQGKRLGFVTWAYNEQVEGPMANKKRKADKRRKPLTDRRAMKGVSAGRSRSAQSV